MRARGPLPLSITMNIIKIAMNIIIIL